MQMLDDIISDGQMDGIEKIERLEAILSAVTCTTNDSNSSHTKCTCQQTNNVKSTKSVACQTHSTGDIVITRIFFTEEEKEREKLLNSPKK